jgi:mycothiol synthase
VPAVTALVAAYDAALHGAPDISEEDIRDDWDDPGLDPARDIWLLHAGDGGLIGYARLASLSPARPARIDLFVHPAEMRFEGVRALLPLAEKRRLESTEGRAAEHAAEIHAAIGVMCPCADTEMRRALDDAGYRQVRTFLRMEIDLGAGPDPVPPAATAPAPAARPLPEGIEIRPFRPGQDDRAIHAVIEDSFAEHFEFSPRPFDVWWSQHTKHERFDPALWLMAWDGDRAAGALTGYDFIDMGFVRELGVLERYRGKGIATALLLRSFEVIRKRGLPRAVLGVDAENHTGAIRLYERLGMRVTQRHDLVQKRLRP